MYWLDDVNLQTFPGVQLWLRKFKFVYLVILRRLRVFPPLQLSIFVKLSSKLLDLLLLSRILFLLQLLCPLSLGTLAIIVFGIVLVYCGKGMFALNDLLRQRRFCPHYHRLSFFR